MKKLKYIVVWMLMLGIVFKSIFLGGAIKETIVMANSKQTTETEMLDNETYIEANEDSLEAALVEYSKDAKKSKRITSLSEMYGDSISEEEIISIAKIQICSYYNILIKDFKNINNITLRNKVLLYDANNYNTYIGFNYVTSDNNTGYITIATHTKTPLIREINDKKSLPKTRDKIYYLSEEEFYFKFNNRYKTLNGNILSKNKMQKLKAERIKSYYSFTTELLASIELDNIVILNNIIYLTKEVSNINEIIMQKKYEGQDGEGYGGISDPAKYLADRYGGTVTLKNSKILSMDSFICNDFKEKNNCTLVAITRILKYYNKKGYTKIPSNYEKIYSKVLKVAKNYGYSEKNGTFPTKINNIIDDVLDDYNYSKSYSKAYYIWSFNSEIKGEIDNNRPVIMNILRGYYGDHSVTVCGYRIYKTKHKLPIAGSYTRTHNMVCVYDGWKRQVRYIDFEAFAFDLISSGFGSFNTVIMKK